MKMMKLTRSDWIAIEGLLLFMAVVGMWTVDVSVSAMINEPYCGEVETTNGFISHKPLQTYHIGLWLVSLSSFAQFMVFAHLMGGKNGRK